MAEAVGGAVGEAAVDVELGGRLSQLMNNSRRTNLAS